MQRLVLAFVFTSASLLATAVLPAQATTMRTCPDGTRVPDSQPCPGKTGRPIKGKPQIPPFVSLPDVFVAEQAPKPSEPAKKHRTFINGNPKPPPIQPKK